MTTRWIIPLLVPCALTATGAEAQTIGVNVLLNTPPTAPVLAQLEAHGQVLDVMPEINAVTVRAPDGDLAVIQALPCVAGAAPDSECEELMETPTPPASDFANGSTLWNLDAINVTDSGTTRTVPYDGAGVYIAVIDSGLYHNWRVYFPEERIATQFAMSFGGGGGVQGNVSTQPNTWENDTNGHGTFITSVLLGFDYFGIQQFNGVAPRATIIPVKTLGEFNSWMSRKIRAILYVANLKTSGALGTSPVVITASWGTTTPDPVLFAAVDYAIAHGVVFVAAAANFGAAGMAYPAALPQVISAAALGWIGQTPPDDPTHVWWILRDVPENDPSQYFIADFSSRALPGQDLDVAAPGYGVPRPFNMGGQDYGFWKGTSAAAPHVAGVVALMLQKNPGLSQPQIETILEGTAMPLPPGCRTFRDGSWFNGQPPTWSDHSSVIFGTNTMCWDADATGHGLIQADAALAATPMP